MILFLTSLLANPAPVFRAGGGASVGPAGAGPTLSIEGGILSDRWVGGLRIDASRRHLVTLTSQDLSFAGEVGAVTSPTRRLRLQGTVTGGLATSSFERERFCYLEYCSTRSFTTGLRPELGGSLGVLAADSRVWFGLRGSVLSPSISLMVTVGPKF